MTKGHSEYVPFIDELPHIIESFFSALKGTTNSRETEH